MKDETITIEIMVLSDAEHRTLFAKVADKALKINASQIADYDATQVINRIAHSLADENACGVQPAYGHGGEFPGFLTEAWTLASLDRAVVVMVNTSERSAISRPVAAADEALCG